MNKKKINMTNEVKCLVRTWRQAAGLTFEKFAWQAEIRVGNAIRFEQGVNVPGSKIFLRMLNLHANTNATWGQTYNMILGAYYETGLRYVKFADECNSRVNNKKTIRWDTVQRMIIKRNVPAADLMLGVLYTINALMGRNKGLTHIQALNLCLSQIQNGQIERDLNPGNYRDICRVCRCQFGDQVYAPFDKRTGLCHYNLLKKVKNRRRLIVSPEERRAMLIPAKEIFRTGKCRLYKQDENEEEK